ncbi:hypothetical protein F0U44_01745 [Nocardioides humilatus]|uniref:Calx-beta domain-containing protein n=1 Tax=Nocardioides humilatus TaxID=2607660 RepID=A0A5B1LKI9_9ACTN|nr:Calx-beta domain-containing protein [Nocardioides humilatus]KAA1421073.1 hypothetical protein F0U44_01745 [Nocardioides humilatus]
MQRFLDRAARRTTTVAAAAALACGALAMVAPPASAATPAISAIPFALHTAEGNTGQEAYGLYIYRTGDTSGVSKVTVATVDGTATAPTDYTAKAATVVTFRPGENGKYLNVTIKGDQVIEPDESFYFQLSSPVNATIDDGTGEVVIDNDDSNDPPAFVVDGPATLEGDTTHNLTFAIHRTGSSIGTVSVKVATRDGTAVAPGDYKKKALSVVRFTNGQNLKNVLISIKGDLVPEGNEIFYLDLSSPVGAALPDPTATANVFNDDSSAPTAIEIYGSPQPEGDSFSHKVDLYVYRSGNLQGTTTAHYATADGTATAPSDYAAKTGTVTFRPGVTYAIIQITVKGGTEPEPDEQFTVSFTDVTGANVYVGTGTVTITNDD